MQCSVDQVEHYTDEDTTKKFGINKENIETGTIANRLAETTM